MIAKYMHGQKSSANKQAFTVVRRSSSSSKKVAPRACSGVTRQQQMTDCGNFKELLMKLLMDGILSFIYKKYFKTNFFNLLKFDFLF